MNVGETMANPQKEDGYTPIANELLEQIYKLKLNGTQFKIILVIWRYTYGFNRKEHQLSETFISKATETNKKQISREMNALIKLNIIKVIEEATFTSSRIIGLNKNYVDWYSFDREVTNSLPPNKSEDGTGIGLEDSTGSELEGSTGSGLAPQEKKDIKQNLNTNIKQKERELKTEKKSKIYYPEDELLNQTILQFIEFRKKIKAPMTEHAIDLLIRKLNQLGENNDDKIEILNQSIMNGWKSVFPLKQETIYKRDSRPMHSTHSNVIEQMVEESMKVENINYDELEEGVL